jgi:uncharacterized membrane protein
LYYWFWRRANNTGRRQYVRVTREGIAPNICYLSLNDSLLRWCFTPPEHKRSGLRIGDHKIPCNCAWQRIFVANEKKTVAYACIKNLEETTLMTQTSYARTWHLTGLLLFAAWLRIRYLVDFIEWPDEIYSMWRTQGSLSRLLHLILQDWPPLYGIIHWHWVQVVGPTLEASRYLSVLFSLLGITIIYRAARSLLLLDKRSSTNGHISAVLAAVAYSTMAYTTFAGV